MPRFAYRALAKGGTMVEGQLTTGSRDRAVDLLRRRRLVPVAIEETLAESSRVSDVLAWARDRASGRDALLEFTRDFAVLLDAGVSVGRALAMMADSPGSARALVARRLLARVRAGASVATAMEAEPDLFPAHYVGMVRAGEEGSSLGEVLGRVAAMLERMAALRTQLRTSLAYPVLVLCLGTLTMVLLLVFVIPEFRPVFEHSGSEIPVSAKVLLAASELAVEYGWAIGPVLLVLFIVLRQSRWSTSARLALDHLALRLPIIGSLVVRVETARFCRTLGTLVINGVVLIEAARIAIGAISNVRLAADSRKSLIGLAEGEEAVDALGRAGWLPARAVQVMSVGAESGRLGEMLLRIADIYEAESARTMQRLVNMVTPATTMLLGGMIAFMIWSVVSTILGSYSQALQ
jgi:general secretion pathway protein F